MLMHCNPNRLCNGKRPRHVVSASQSWHTAEFLKTSDDNKAEQGDLPMPKRVLILCTGNSCRSQMAEYLWNQLGEGEWIAESAGSNPAGYVHPFAVAVMKEQGQDMGTATSKHVDQFLSEPIDLVVTVCDAAQESCPTLPQAAQSLHWPFFDPAEATGNDEEKLEVFRQVRNEIRTRIEHFLDGPAG